MAPPEMPSLGATPFKLRRQERDQRPKVTGDGVIEGVLDPLRVGLGHGTHPLLAVVLDGCTSTNGKPDEKLVGCRPRALCAPHGDNDEVMQFAKVSLIPESVPEIRVVDIVGLDRQADGGTHVRTTDEVGRIRVLKTESKGKGNKRIRIEVVDG
jgi:misacylated tRNA(Ala) deacylase